MRSELFVLAAELVAKEEPFALATVVRRQPASSAQAGDGALITADGAFHGWLGGSCTQPTVVREALKAIADGAPRLIALAPDPQTEKRPGILVFPMTCHSGGSVDIYIEPVLPPARLLVFGVSPVAQALARLGHAMGFAVDVADPAAERAAFPPEIAERVWTDPEAPGPAAFRAAGPSPSSRRWASATRRRCARRSPSTPAYLGVVASRKRFAEIEAALVRGRRRARRARAAIQQPGRPRHRRARARGDRRLDPRRDRARAAAAADAAAEPARPAGLPTLAAPTAEERDPVCGMIGDRRGRATHGGGRAAAPGTSAAAAAARSSWRRPAGSRGTGPGAGA